MAGAKVENIDAAKATEDGKRERSTIEFPYGDLEDAVSVARAIHDNAGIECETNSLAGFMNQTVSSGAFRQKLATAATFKVTVNERGKVSLTEIGRRIVNPQFERQAKADAFLSVSLYKAIYEKYSGHLLPPAIALEREMQQLGVSSKQANKARQAFDRSAQQAGFFWKGKDRLIPPSNTSKPETKPLDQEIRDREEGNHRRGSGDGNGADGGGGGRGGDGLELDQLLMALLRKIPKATDKWPADNRLRWFRTFAMNVSQVYDDSDPVELEITLKATKKHADAA